MTATTGRSGRGTQSCRRTGRRTGQSALVPGRNNLRGSRIPSAVARVHMYADAVGDGAQLLLHQRLPPRTDDRGLQLIRDLGQRRGLVRDDMHDVPAELRVHLDETAGLGREDGVGERLHELAVTLEPERATVGLAPGVEGVL